MPPRQIQPGEELLPTTDPVPWRLESEVRSGEHPKLKAALTHAPAGQAEEPEPLPFGERLRRIESDIKRNTSAPTAAQTFIADRMDRSTRTVRRWKQRSSPPDVKDRRRVLLVLAGLEQHYLRPASQRPAQELAGQRFDAEDIGAVEYEVSAFDGAREVGRTTRVVETFPRSPNPIHRHDVEWWEVIGPWVRNLSQREPSPGFAIESALAVR